MNQEPRQPQSTSKKKSILRVLTGEAVKVGIKKGAKKAAVWLATKLGVELGITAAGTVIAPGVGTLIGAAISLALKVIGKVVKTVWDKLKQVVREPEKALGWLAAGVLAITLLPMPIALVGIVPITMGGIGLISWGVSSAGGIASSFASNVAAFFTALVITPLTAPIAFLTIAIIGGIAVLTFITVITTAGAFILPVGPTELVPGPPPPDQPPTVEPPPGLAFRWPVDSPMTCSSNYGYRVLAIRGKPTCDYHESIDIPTSWDAPAYSTAEGVVYDTGFHSGYGIYAVVKHNGFYSFYAHLSGVAAFEGESVDHSTILGYVDNTGFSTGTHLHFGFSSCGSVPGCFNNGSLTPNPCDYLTTANPVCPESCGYRDRTTGCPSL